MDGQLWDKGNDSLQVVFRISDSQKYVLCVWLFTVITSCRWAAATVCRPPAPLLPRGRRSAFRRVADGDVAAVSHAHHCSRLTRQHGREQSGLVTLTLTFLTWKVVSESRLTWATPVLILVSLGLSVLDLGPMYATDRQTDRRQSKASLNAPTY